jgi:hypothetical protein
MAKTYTENELLEAFRAGAKFGAWAATDSVLGNVASSYKLELGRKDINGVALTERDPRYMDGRKAVRFNADFVDLCASWAQSDVVSEEMYPFNEALKQFLAVPDSEKFDAFQLAALHKEKVRA